MTDDRSESRGQDEVADATAPDATVPDEGTLDVLASQLVWRIGRTADDAPLTVRVGFVGSTPAFAELPRLRNATDSEIQQALEEDDLRVEWVGPRRG